MSTRERLKELMRPIEEAVLHCDDPTDLLLLACGMMQHVREIFDSTIGVEGRKIMFEGEKNENKR
ncbi:hypothetical protein UFOVP961_93 [uncultured Caudovirales phage]|uniref:Uncharacterized protein n=1 Tax=uncultured Caudovirales phage TaxID=2100421 RepID=A0A6J5R078_9CAUD|nr:hypothetical protein UFOVP961_93 [uncultured Caudovirales phage]CAB4185134.1 hypothetical protein UFOVP1123_21 [uncultured Caudovirales phage]CAB4193680.1 hypothetical protein UFOVP1239_129 [uncultured Caudovirales phage]CAB4215826.1 hypothetical protein UFOVP1484_25 [uncultured Caudovirales phage]CAB5230626.1 hypothetical protein UFOVP1577_31 [uncultured Caudovirales phage]